MFINENFICIWYNKLDNLTNKDKDEIREKYNCDGGKLANHLGNVNAFVNTMAKGDIVLITENDWVHIGSVGDYKYDFDNKQLGMCHRRGVNWRGKVQKYQLNDYVRELLRNRSIITKFKHPTDIAELDKFLINSSTIKNEETINFDIIEKALNVLTKALNSDNEEIRVKAATGKLFKQGWKAIFDNEEAVVEKDNNSVLVLSKSIPDIILNLRTNTSFILNVTQAEYILEIDTLFVSTLNNVSDNLREFNASRYY